MATVAEKITELTASTAPAAGDLAAIVDVSDTTMAATGTTKKLTLDYLLLQTTKPCNSKGNSFSTVQAAIDDLAGDGWVFVPAGTWSEALTISNNNMMLFGSGRGSIIDGGTTGHAVPISANHCVVRDLQVKTTTGQANAYNGIDITGDYNSIMRVFVNGSDNMGIDIADGAIHNNIADCYIHAPDIDGIEVGGLFTQITGNYISTAGQYGIELQGVTGGDSVVVGNVIDGTGNDGVYIGSAAENCVVVGNRITNWTNEAIDDDSGTSTVASNDTT